PARQVEEEFFRHHVDGAFHLHLRFRLRRQHHFVGQAGDDEDADRDQDQFFPAFHCGSPPSELLPRSRAISTRRLRGRPPAVELEPIGRWPATPLASSRRAVTPWPIMNRTTPVARATESSQLLGYCEVEMGTSSVFPSTEMAWSRSRLTRRAISE